MDFFITRLGAGLWANVQPAHKGQLRASLIFSDIKLLVDVKSVMVGIFTPQKSASMTSQCFPPMGCRLLYITSILLVLSAWSCQVKSMSLYRQAYGNNHKVICGLKSLWNCRISNNAYIWSGNLNESAFQTKQLKGWIWWWTFLGALEIMGREEVGVFWWSQKQKAWCHISKQVSGAFTAGQLRVQVKWSFLTHPLRDREDDKGLGWAIWATDALMVSLLAKHPLAHNY